MFCLLTSKKRLIKNAYWPNQRAQSSVLLTKTTRDAGEKRREGRKTEERREERKTGKEKREEKRVETVYTGYC